MPHVRTQHPNASLTPQGRRKMVRLVIDTAGRSKLQPTSSKSTGRRVRCWGRLRSRSAFGHPSPQPVSLASPAVSIGSYGPVPPG